MSESGPQPTAQEIATECKLTRRRALQSVGLAAGATATGVTFGTDSARAAEGLVDGVVSAIPGVSAKEAVAYGVASTNPFSLAVMAGTVGLAHLDNALNDSPSADKAILHQLCTSEYENLIQHEDLFGNRLKDAKPIASLEARHGMATTWEDGGSASEMYDNAMSRVRQYYELPEFNHYHVTAKSLLQLGYAGEAAIETGDDAFVVQTGDDDSGNTIQCRFRANPTEVSITLSDGTAIENVDPDEEDDVARDDGSTALKVPQIHLQDTTNGTDLGTTPALDQSVVDSWDPDAETIQYTADDGTTVTLDGPFVIPSVGDDLGTERVWDPAETFKILDEIQGQSDTVVSNYSQTFVEDIKAELDAGNLSPSNVRSPEGVARYLSGTDDPTADAFRIAMLQQFGMQQPDFSKIARMEVTWSGATDKTVDTDPNLDARHVYPTDRVDSTTYNGVLFGSDVPAGGFDPGESYAVGLPMYYGEDATLRAVDAISGNLLWEESYSDDVYATAVSEDGGTLFVGIRNGSVYALDTSDGSQLWSASIGGRAEDMVMAPSGDHVIIADFDTTAPAIAFNVDDGSEAWTWSPTDDIGAGGLALSNDGSTLYVGVDNMDVYALDPANGTQTGNPYSADSTQNIESIDISPDDSTLYFINDTGDGFVSFDIESESINWSHSDADFQGLIAGPEGDHLYVIRYATSSQLYEFNLADQTEGWSYGVSSDGATEIALDPGYDSVRFADADSNVHLVDREDGTGNQIINGSGSLARDLTIRDVDVSGMAASALIFDEDTADTDGEGEVDLVDGVVDVISQSDADGNTVTHVTDQTISDIESLTETPDSIDTIISEMDQFDSQSDIRYRKDVLDILEFYDAEDKESEVSIEDSDYQDVKYNTYDSSEFANEMENALEEYKEMLEAEQSTGTSDSDSDGPLFGGIFSDQNGGALVGLAIVALVVMGIVSAAINKIPLVGK